MLLTQFIKRRKQAFYTTLTRFSERADDGFGLANSLSQDASFCCDPLDIFNQVVEVLLVCLFLAIESILCPVILAIDRIEVGDFTGDLMLLVH